MNATEIKWVKGATGNYKTACGRFTIEKFGNGRGSPNYCVDGQSLRSLQWFYTIKSAKQFVANRANS